MKSHSNCQNKEKGASSLEDLSILIVEDEIIVATDIQIVLNKLGYKECSIASGGKDAIVKITENKPDLIIMDIRLKDEMDGIEAAERIQKNFYIPIIYISALSDEDTLRRAKKTKPFFFISKPIEEGELLAAINKASSMYKKKSKLKSHKSRNDNRDAFFRVLKMIAVSFLNYCYRYLTLIFRQF